MRAMQVTAYDQPLSMQELDVPAPEAGQVLVKVHTCGLNFGDLLIIKGTYQEKPQLPFTLGMELCGTVTEVGEDNSDEEFWFTLPVMYTRAIRIQSIPTQPVRNFHGDATRMRDEVLKASCINQVKEY